MRSFLILIFFLYNVAYPQTNFYSVSFDNAVHHEGIFTLKFPEVSSDTLSIRMANSSPGRYAFHSFAKNVYNFKAFDEKT